MTVLTHNFLFRSPFFLFHQNIYLTHVCSVCSETRLVKSILCLRRYSSSWLYLKYLVVCLRLIKAYKAYNLDSTIFLCRGTTPADFRSFGNFPVCTFGIDCAFKCFRCSPLLLKQWNSLFCESKCSISFCLSLKCTSLYSCVHQLIQYLAPLADNKHCTQVEHHLEIWNCIIYLFLCMIWDMFPHLICKNWSQISHAMAFALDLRLSLTSI